MTERDALLRAICESPADDTVRLAFADWLDEHGEGERGEFVRVQVEIARLERRKVELLNDETDWDQCTGISAGWCPNCGDCCCPHDGEGNYDSKDYVGCPLHAPESSHACGEMTSFYLERRRKREGELFTPDWLPDFGGQLREWYFSCYPAKYRPERPFSFVVSRGFVSAITLTQADFLVHARAIFQSQPVTAVTLSDREPYRAQSYEGWFWIWTPDDDADNPDAESRHRIADVLWSRPGLSGPNGIHKRAESFDSPDAARAMLSAVCVDWGREFAGLPPL